MVMAYFDYAAHTPISRSSKKILVQALNVETANDQSAHMRGMSIRRTIDAAFVAIRRELSLRRVDDIVMTGGGTESNILGLDALTAGIEKGTFLMSSIEHDSIRQYAKRLREQGWNIFEAPVDTDGIVDLRKFERIARETRPHVISIMMVNNEVGTVQPIQEIVSIARSIDPQVRIHSDAAQAPLYLSINMHVLNVDAISLCSQKIYGPQGIGMLIATKKSLARISARGTTPYALTLAMSHALIDAQKNVDMYSKRMRALRDYFLKRLNKEKISYIVYGNGLPLASYISFPDVKHDSEYMVSYLSQHDIDVSSRSACLGSTIKQPYVLDAMGYKRVQGLRISFGNEISKSDIRTLVRRIQELHD